MKTSLPTLLLFLCLVSISSTILITVNGKNDPFTPKAYSTRYWSKQISNNLPKSTFLLSKASPLTATESATFSKLATHNSLSTHLSKFCNSAKLFCFPDLSSSTDNKHDKDSNFATYSDQNFTNYGTDKTGGSDQFKAYSENENLPVNSFRRYSRNSEGHDDAFSAYSTNGNVVDNQFNTYGTATTGGSGVFNNYDKDVNVVNAKFTSYSTDGTGRKQSFQNYLTGNVGDQKFTSYGKNADGTPNDFTTYGKDSNVLGSGFSGYGENANSVENTFKGYSEGGNNPQNHFDNYGEKGNGAVETFTSYRDQSNVGDDSFQSYSKNSNSAKVNFVNYGKSFNEGTDKFTGYGKGAQGLKVGFKIYGVNNTFKGYAKTGVTFAKYTNDTTSAEKMEMSDSVVNKWVEPGKFFRESKMKTGAVLPMPDIQDKMPERSFLPRSISSKLPFSSSKIGELKQIFHAGDNSTMEKLISDALVECEREPSKDETKRCVGSLEDMIDFVTSVLGRNVVVRTTENTKGSKTNIMIGEIKKINGGKVTKSVSCHQSLYPYLLYYCHSVPKVRVYEADILDSKTKEKINHGTAICHLDTSVWSPSHGAFLALGSSPGKIEVCHWIFENDMTWTTAD
ncbi:hypothetical protein ACFE04_022084 [Oxalis oulophora]